MLEKEILANSRLAATHSAHTPYTIGSMIIASIYFVNGYNFWGFTWIVLTVINLLKERKQIKLIRRLYK